MMTQLVDELTVLGFSERVAKAYVMLAQNGEVTARDVGTRFTLARGTAHDVMMSLVNHGLARTRQSRKEKIFVLESPMMIREKLEEQRRLCTMRLERFEAVLPNLQALASLGGGLCSAVRYVEGKTAITNIHHEFDMLFGSAIRLCADRGYDQSTSQKHERETRTIVITHDTPRVRVDVNENIRRIPHDMLSIFGEIRVCADRVLFSSYADESVAIEIRSQVIADVCRATLELAWHTAGKIEEWSGMKSYG